MAQKVLLEKKDNIAILTLNRPEKRNAISQELLVDLYDNLEAVTNDPSIHAAIMTGAGTSFCAGLDLKRLLTDNLMDPRGDGSDFLDIIRACPKPLIGAVNGPAITGGFELALNMDFLIASSNAMFKDTHAAVGIHPGWGMSQLLQRAVGIRMARQMSLTAQTIDAETALRLGLVNEVVSPEDLMPRTLEIAAEICKKDSAFIAMYKNLINQGHGLSQADAMALEKTRFDDFLRKSGMMK